jgi:hypothetical protein
VLRVHRQRELGWRCRGTDLHLHVLFSLGCHKMTPSFAWWHLGAL